MAKWLIKPPGGRSGLACKAAIQHCDSGTEDSPFAAYIYGRCLSTKTTLIQYVLSYLGSRNGSKSMANGR